MKPKKRFEETELVETLLSLEGLPDGEKYIATINIIANLMWELQNERRTAATYTRQIAHGKLRITINYNDETIR